MSNKSLGYWEKAIIGELKKRWDKSDRFLPCHGPEHHLRVWQLSKRYARKFKNIDYEILAAACLLHDIIAFNKTPIKNHDIESGKLARKILNSLGFDKNKIRIVYRIISNHRSAKEQKGGLEGQIMRAFDKIDALGVIGIYRIITPMAIRGYDLKTINKWFNTNNKVKIKWQSIRFPDLRKKYEEEYNYTLNFFKKLSKFS